MQPPRQTSCRYPVRTHAAAVSASRSSPLHEGSARAALQRKAAAPANTAPIVDRRATCTCHHHGGGGGIRCELTPVRCLAEPGRHPQGSTHSGAPAGSRAHNAARSHAAKPVRIPHDAPAQLTRTIAHAVSSSLAPSAPICAKGLAGHRSALCGHTIRPIYTRL